VVEEVEFFAGLEADGFAGSDADFGPGAGVAADAGLAGTDVEDAKAAELDALAFGEGALEALEDGIHSGFGLVALQAGALNHLVNDVLFDQGLLRSGAGSDSRLIVEIFCDIVNVARLP